MNDTLSKKHLDPLQSQLSETGLEGIFQVGAVIPQKNKPQRLVKYGCCVFLSPGIFSSMGAKPSAIALGSFPTASL